MIERELQEIYGCHDWWLVKFAVRLMKVDHLKKRYYSGLPALQGSFDPFMQNVVAPYIILTRIGKSVVEVCFLYLEYLKKQKVFFELFYDVL